MRSQFGVPQTRSRKYMLIYRPEKHPAGMDELWEQLCYFLWCPLKFDVDSFLLSDENERVHRFRDALQGPAGRLTATSRQKGDWWTENANKDTDHAKNHRACKHKEKGPAATLAPIEQKARPFTNWGPHGDMLLASAKWWPEYMSTLSQRELDLIDCFGIKMAEQGCDALVFRWYYQHHDHLTLNNT